jgi:hypothetical protein
MAKIPGNRVINGSYGTLWWDGELVFEVSSFNTKITANRDKQTMAGSLDEDSKITSLTGEGTFKIKKVFSRGQKALLEAWKAGTDPRSQLMGKLKDPDTLHGGAERVVIGNVWFNELTIMDFEGAKPGEIDYPFGFTASSASYPDTIPVTEG